ncbi:unnamed protein product [Peronospora belbahrii]|uniref:Alcohol dehydrogenase-like C-terminal domain-containing protein n=1 Tax=Peronospora belbahrii TaxID=622444 RepID=A0ABN8D6P7_9STRA|nr:unnamed protein product [Peronospora belbahrii]
MSLVRRHTGQVLHEAEVFCHKLPSYVSLQEGALLEFLAVAMHFCRLAKVYPGNSVVVFGVVPVGLFACKAASYVFGATTVVGVDVNKARLEFAKDNGATHVFRNNMRSTPQKIAEQIIVRTDVKFLIGERLKMTGNFRFLAGDNQLALDMSLVRRNVNGHCVAKSVSR